MRDWLLYFIIVFVVSGARVNFIEYFIWKQFAPVGWVNVNPALLPTTLIFKCWVIRHFCVAYLHCKYSHTLLASRMFHGMRSSAISDIQKYCLLI